MTKRKASLLAGAVFLALLLLQETPIGPALEDHLSFSLELGVRNLLHRAPPLAPGISIVALPETDPNGLSAREWSAALTEIYSHKPRAVLVEHDFSRSFGEMGDRGFLAAAAGFPRLAAGVRVVNRKTDEVTAHLSPRPELSLESFFGDRIQAARKVPWLRETFPNLEGPTATLLPAFHQVGQLESENAGRVTYVHPLLRIDDKSALPYLGFYSGKPMTVVGDRLLLDGIEIPLDGEGRVPVNLPSAESLAKASAELSLAPEHATLTSIHEGDTVFVVPMPPDSTTSLPLEQRIATHHGYLPAAVLSSALTGEWLRPIDAGLPITFLFCALGLALGLAFEGRKLALSVGITVLSMIIISLWACLAIGWMLPWTHPLLGLGLTASLIYFTRAPKPVQRKRHLRLVA